MSGNWPHPKPKEKKPLDPIWDKERYLPPPPPPKLPKRPSGFSLLTPEKRKEIASMGGKTAQAKGTAHRFDSETGKVAGAKSRKNKPKLTI